MVWYVKQKKAKNVIRHSPGGKSAEVRQGCWRKSYSGNLSSSVNPREALKSARTALFKGMVTSTLRNIIRPLYKIFGSILAGSPVLTPRSSDVLLAKFLTILGLSEKPLQEG